MPGPVPAVTSPELHLFCTLKLGRHPGPTREGTAGAGSGMQVGGEGVPDWLCAAWVAEQAPCVPDPADGTSLLQAVYGM